MPRKANPDKAPVVRATHMKREDGFTLCGKEANDKTLFAETTEAVTCKRCLKVASAPKKEAVEGDAAPKAKRTRKTKGKDASAPAKRKERRACDWGKDYIRTKYGIEEDPETGKLFKRLPDGFPVEYKIVGGE